MTSGTKTQDERFLLPMFSQNDCSSSGGFVGVTVGRYYQKTWSGADQPHSSSPPTPSQGYSYLVPVYKRYLVRVPRRQLYDRQGRKKPLRYKLVQRKYIERYKLVNHWYKAHVALAYGEHGYTSTTQHFFADGFVRQFPCGIGTPNYPKRIGAISLNGLLPAPGSQNWSSNDDIALNGKLREKIQGSDFNVAVFLGEGRESLATVADGANRIYRALLFLKNGKVGRATRELLHGRPRTYRSGRPGKITGERHTFGDDRPLLSPVGDISRELVTREWFASNWLQLQYGWQPLIQDIWAAMQHFSHMRAQPEIKKYRASRTVKSVGSVYAPGWTPEYSRVYTRKSIIAKVTHVNQAVLLGLTDPLSLAWEKLPYSFVCDWFIPIGNYLQALQLGQALTATYVSSSKVNAEMGGLVQGINSGGQIVGGQGTYSKRSTFNRVVSSTIPAVTLPTFKGWDKVASVVHATNACALLINLFR